MIPEIDTEYYDNTMNVLTIPRKFAKQDDLVVIPRSEYEALLGLREMKEFRPTPAQKRALLRAEKNLQRGKTLSYPELAQRLGVGG